MIIVDFLFYYLALYFTQNKQTLNWSTPEQRDVYALALISISWMIALLFFVLVYVLKTKTLIVNTCIF